MLKIQKENKLVIGLIHLKPMPNTPYYTPGDLDCSLEKALRDTDALLKGGADGCLVQSVDRVYPATDDTDYVRVAGIAVIAREVKKLAGQNFLVGVQLMWNCITPSLAAAKASNADFVRCSVLVGETKSPFGNISGNPLKVLNYRKNIDAEKISLISEIAGYHYLIEDAYNKKSLMSIAQQAVMVGTDCIEVYHKDEEINEHLVRDIKEVFPSMPVILGGGTNIENCKSRLKYADGALVGSCFEGGKWGENLDVDIIKAYVSRVREL
jgi:membrane complex biogenesis BtpA family protein